MKTTREKTYREVLLDYLTSIAPRKATRQEIRLQTGLQNEQMLNGLLDLQRAGRIQSAVDSPDAPRLFWVELSANSQLGSVPRKVWRHAGHVSPDFETLALTCLCRYLGCHLARSPVSEHDKAFISSEDGTMLAEIVNITDADSLLSLEECRQQLASLHVPHPMLITGGDFDALWAWFNTQVTMAQDVVLYFITPEGEIILLDAEMVEG